MGRTRDQIKLHKDNRARKMRLIAWAHKCSHPCVDCGEPDPIVLDFDHRDRKAKSFTISAYYANVSEARLRAEIAKCDVRCANCHRRKTADENLADLLESL